MTGDIMGDGQADMEPCGCPHMCGHRVGSGSVSLSPQLVLYPCTQHPWMGDVSPLQVGGDREQERETKCTGASSPEQDSSIRERKERKKKELQRKRRHDLAKIHLGF